MKIIKMFISAVFIYGTIYTSPGLAFNTDCVGDFNNSTNSIRLKCNYTCPPCPNPDEWQTWRSNVTWLAVGIAVPYILQGLNFLRTKAIDWYHERRVRRDFDESDSSPDPDTSESRRTR